MDTKAYKKQSVAKGALILGICGFLSKIIGAVYRIPLTNIIGAEGMGLYQMVFPLYALLLTISATGMPAAIAKLVSEKEALKNYRGIRQTFFTALVSLTIIGLLASIAVYLFSYQIAKIQGNQNAGLAYIAISPAIVLVALICVYRGYFQGRRNMTPSAVSQIIEQVIKLVVGLVLAKLLLKKGIIYAVAGALLGVAVSEAAALIVLVLQYIVFCKKYPLEKTGQALSARHNLKELYKTSIPITLGGLILPLSQLIDSIMIINLLKAGGSGVGNATATYGLLTGPVGSLINMPVVLSFALATAVLPALAGLRATGEHQKIAHKIGRAIKYCWLISLPCFLGIALLAPQLIDLLYGGGLSVDQRNTAQILLTMSSISVVYIAFSQLFVFVLQGLGRYYRPLLSLGIAAAIKVVATFILTKTYGIFGAAASTVICYAAAALIGAYLLNCEHIFLQKERGFFGFTLLSGGAMSAVVILCTKLLWRLIGTNAALITAVVLGALIYGLFLVLFGTINAQEIEALPLGKKLAKIVKKLRKDKKNIQ